MDVSATDREPFELGRAEPTWVGDELTNVLCAALDHVDAPLMVVGRYGTLLFANCCAKADFTAPTGTWTLSGGRIVPVARQSTDAYLVAVSAALDRQLHSLVDVGQGGIARSVAVLPARGRLDCRAQVWAALVVGTRRNIASGIVTQWISASLDITLAECRVLQLLCQGSSPTDVADVQGVALSTVRTQISSLRAKAGVESISSLLRLMALLPPVTTAEHLPLS